MEIPLLHLKILIFLQMYDGSEGVEFSRRKVELVSLGPGR